MTYRIILVELVDDALAEARLLFARGLAQRFQAELVGIHVSPPFLAAGYESTVGDMGVEVFEAPREAHRLVRERVEAQFRRVCGADAAAVRDLYLEGDPGILIGEAARSVDLTIAVQVASPAAGPILARPFDQIVLGAGGPVLMLPREIRPQATVDTVLVAWNGSREAARATKDALPLLAAAREVVLMGAGETAAESLSDAADLLGRHDVPVRVIRIERDPGGAGSLLLATAEEVGADLLVMGAYGHARWREIVLGGETRRVSRDARIPVLFSG